MFEKILIANRGEIACRVMKTARRMGIATVAVYSDADANAPHVQMADEAVHIGPAVAAESYLVMDRIMDAIRQTGAQAVHPGYGFLSENAAFAQRLKDEGVAFIGPPVGAIEAMGDKITSKKLADEAGVSTVPGHMGLIEDAEEAVKIATRVGYPVMIKASAGGGGKGMRIAWNDDEAREGFALSRSEAKSSFGDERIFIEKFVQKPRHIEIQVLGDTHGNIVYLGERECSIQRRNQKVIEEAPSPFLDAETRKAMGEQSVALSRAVDYCSAGTVEFIVDPDRNFYFLEMNTRLQVEHPVTELITGIDLVEQMIRVAAGEPLSIAQDDVKLNGWAIESRLYAEDPYRNFLPSIGRLTRYRPPVEGQRESAVVRNDTGVEEGGEISMYYDPMIAKLCTWAPDRTAAIDGMQDALDGFELEGIGHNIPFLQAVMNHARFRSGDISTAFIEEEYPEGFEGAALSADETATAVALAALAHVMTERRKTRVSGILPNRARVVGEDWVAMIDDPVAGRAAHSVKVLMDADIPTVQVGDGDIRRIQTNWTPGQPVMRALVEGREVTIKIAPEADALRLRWRGASPRIAVRSPRAAELAALMPIKLPPDTSKFLLCPMPGLVVSIMVEEGDEVQEGQALAVVEAMKMENVLRAEKRGIVTAVKAEPGASLAVDDVILEFG